MNITLLKCEYQINPAAIDNKKPRLSWIIAGELNNNKQIGYKVLVASSKENIENGISDMWNSKFIDSSNGMNVTYNGKRLLSKKTYWWKVIVCTNEGNEVTSEIARFGMGLLLESEWGCEFIGLHPQYTPISLEAGGKAGAPSPFLRKIFHINKEIKTSKLFATSYGLYELHINGSKVEDCELTPGWTDYTKSIQYQGFEVTKNLQNGENVVGCILGDGWFTGNIANVGRKQYGDYPLGFRMNLTVEYMDGTIDIIKTDSSWKATTGPIIYSDNQLGEYYDARKELTNWDLPQFDDSSWKNVVDVHKFSGTKFKANIGPLVKTVIYKNVSSIKLDKNGHCIVDMGQNMVGNIAFKLIGKQGDKVVLRYGEMINDDGTLYTENLRSASQTDTYIACGDEQGEYFEPRFTIHGFQYIEISGLSYLPKPEDIKGKVIYSDCELTGKIETSDELVNQLFSNQLWGQRGNFISVPTDCPQRDERMGWTGDAQIFAGTACYNMNCVGFYEKYMEDCRESQRPNGAITDVVPHVKCADGSDLVGYGNAAWGDAIFVIPWTTYCMYGDEKILHDSYDSMLKYIEYLEGTSTNLICPESKYGDWLSIDDDTPNDVLSTAFFAYAAKLTANSARALGKTKDVFRFERMFNDIKKTFNKAFVKGNGVIKGDTQCCYVLALKMELLNSEMKEKAIQHLIRTIERKNWHLSTGFVGVSYLLAMLSENGYNNVAYRLLLNRTYPSWGYSIVNGATTIWERWNSYTVEHGFGNVEMNSFNHYSLGSVGEWMYRYMAGISPLEPGFKKIMIKPFFSDKLDFVKAEYKSISGIIKSSWEKEGNILVISAEIPLNTSSEIYIKDGEISQIKGNVIFVGIKNGYKVFQTESGKFSFDLKLKK